MNDTWKTILAIAGVVAFLLVCGLVTGFQGANNNLVSLQNQRSEALGNFDAGVTFMTQKIEAMWTIMNQAFDAETLLQTGVAEARSNYNDAVSEGNPAGIVEASADFVLAVNAVVENPPTTGFTDLAAGTQREVAEAYNQLYTLLSDVNAATRRYNEYRRSLFMPAIVGSLMGFPESYEFYETDQEIPSSFDDIIN